MAKREKSNGQRPQVLRKGRQFLINTLQNQTTHYILIPALYRQLYVYNRIFKTTMKA